MRRGSHVWHYVACLFPFHLIHIVWPTLLLSLMNRPHIKGKFAKSSEAERQKRRTEVQRLPLRTARYVFCMWMPMQRIEYRWSGDEGSSPRVALTLGVLRMLHPPLHYLLLLLSFSTCAVRGDINLSDRLCDPPCGLGGRRGAVNINILPGIHGGHGAATATMNLHPLSQAGKHEAHQHGWKKKKKKHHHPTTRSANKQSCQFIAGELIVCSFSFFHREGIPFNGFTLKKFKIGLKIWSRFSSKGSRCMKWDIERVCAVFYIPPLTGCDTGESSIWFSSFCSLMAIFC